MESDLQDLIAVPRETLGIELKAWLDPTDKTVRANIARHVAALANHGGGYMVFGFNDDLSRDQNRPSSLESYNRDVFAGIVSRYLTPTFHCEVTIVRDEGGEQFPVIRVPGHGQVPIAAKRSGPEDNRGKPHGLVGRHLLHSETGTAECADHKWRGMGTVDQAMCPKRPRQIAQRHCRLSADTKEI